MIPKWAVWATAILLVVSSISQHHPAETNYLLEPGGSVYLSPNESVTMDTGLKITYLGNNSNNLIFHVDGNEINVGRDEFAIDSGCGWHHFEVIEVESKYVRIKYVDH